MKKIVAKSFKGRLGSFISAPKRCKLLPQKFGQEGVWTRQQEIAGKRRHMPRRWFYRNEERNAYAVNMHLMMRRMAKGASSLNLS